MSVPRVDLTDPSVEPTDDELDALMQSVRDEVVKRHAPARSVLGAAWMKASRKAAAGTVTITPTPEATLKVGAAGHGGIEIARSPLSGLSVLSESAERRKDVGQMRKKSGSGADS